METKNETGYAVGHPWYYVLGGRVLYPSEIRNSIDIENNSNLLIEDAVAADNMVEPKRSETLRALRTKVHFELKCDLSRYRECARDLSVLRKTIKSDAKPEFQNIHCNIGLKANHLYNRFARLIIIDSFLEKQPDLFAML